MVDVPLARGPGFHYDGIMSTMQDVSLEARLAARIRREREARGWSLAELAAQSGVSRAMISKEVGDVVEVNTPGGVKAYEILKVEWK